MNEEEYKTKAVNGNFILSKFIDRWQKLRIIENINTLLISIH
jgi:hypothetical protein